MPWTRFEAWLKDTKTLLQAPEWLFQTSTQAGWKFGMEEVGAIDDWKLPTCAPHTGLACLVRPVANFNYR